MIQSVHTPFRVAVLGAFVAILCPTLFQDGMFMDGLIYACVGKNLSQGIGTWWHPHYTSIFRPDYHEQPPMMFWLQSLFFQLFGTGFWVERFYSLVAAIINAFIISAIWKKLFPTGSEQQSFNWVPILFWISIPVCSFTFINNLEEGTMSIFGLAAVYFILSALTGAKSIFPLLMLAGLLILCAAFTKGIQGTFPIAAVFFYWLVFRRVSFKQMIIYTMVVIGVPILVFVLLLTNSVIYDSFRSYYFDRIYFTFNNDGAQTTGIHFSLFFRLLTELIPVYFLMFLTFIICKVKRIKWQFHTDERKFSTFFLLIGLSAALPLMVTLEQRSFYLTTSLPYFSLSASFLVLPALMNLFARINIQSLAMKVFFYFSIFVILTAGIITVFNFGEAKRDVSMLNDSKIISGETGTNTVIGTSTELVRRWSLQGYLMRYYGISLDQTASAGRNYFLIDKGKSLPEGEVYRKVPLQLQEFDLYRKRVAATE